MEIGGHRRYCGGCAFINKNTNVNATITWNENTEELKLKNKN